MLRSLLLVSILVLSNVLSSTAFLLPQPRFLTNHLSEVKRNKLYAGGSYKSFDEFLAQVDQPVLVDFYAQWCGPCQMMQPVLEDLANRFEGRTRIAKVDTDKAPALGSKYQVEALPTLLLFYKGQVIERYVGFKPADALEKEIEAALKRMNL